MGFNDSVLIMKGSSIIILNIIFGDLPAFKIIKVNYILEW